MDKKLFTHRLKQLRKERARSRNAAAKDLGLNAQTLEKYEKGLTLPNIEIAAGIANYYGVSVNYLLGIDEEPKSEQELVCNISDYTGLNQENVILLHDVLFSSDEYILLDVINRIFPNLLKLCEVMKKYGDLISINNYIKDKNTDVETPKLKQLIAEMKANEDNDFYKWKYLKECEQVLSAYINLIQIEETEKENPRPNDEHSDGE